MFKKIMIVSFFMMHGLIIQADVNSAFVKPTKSSRLRKETSRKKLEQAKIKKNSRLKQQEEYFPSLSSIPLVSSVGSLNSEDSFAKSDSDFDLKNDSDFESRSIHENQGFNDSNKVFKVQRRQSLKRFMTENEEVAAQKRLQDLQKRNNKWKNQNLNEEKVKDVPPVISDEDLESDFLNYSAGTSENSSFDRSIYNLSNQDQQSKNTKNFVKSDSHFDLKNDSDFESRLIHWNQDFNDSNNALKVQRRQSLKRFMTESEEDAAQKRLQDLQKRNNKWKNQNLNEEKVKDVPPVISDEDLESDFSDHV